MEILSVQTAIPVYVKIRSKEWEEPKTILVMVDHATRTIDIPDPQQRNSIQDETVFARLLFQHYESLNTFSVDVPEDVYTQYERSNAAAEAKRVKVKEISNEL